MKTILITGVSSGLGRSMAVEALARGHVVLGTVRQDEQRQAFEALSPGRAIGHILDVTDTAAIGPLIDSIGAIDVLVNNAGYGLSGVVEELDSDALRRQFEVNVFGPVALIQAVLPGMRRRGAGHIVNMASMGSMVAFPGLGAYHGSKFALLGLSDTLQQEVAPLGLHVTAVLPGLFRSDWAGRSQAQTERKIADYEPLLAQKRERTWGDPKALARVVLDAIEMDEPPRHLLVGPTALAQVRQRLAHWTAEIDRWDALSQAGGEG